MPKPPVKKSSVILVYVPQPESSPIPVDDPMGDLSTDRTPVFAGVYTSGVEFSAALPMLKQTWGEIWVRSHPINTVAAPDTLLFSEEKCKRV